MQRRRQPMRAERRTMSVIRWKSFGAGRKASLCASCVWGTVRNGYRRGEVEAFCRLVGPNGLVPFAVRDCTGYADRPARCACERQIHRPSFWFRNDSDSSRRRAGVDQRFRRRSITSETSAGLRLLILRKAGAATWRVNSIRKRGIAGNTDPA